MDVIKRNKENQVSHILVNDHIPNPAFINEFQTSYFSLKLNTIELVENKLNGFKVDQEGMFIVFHVSIRNNTNEILDLYREDFQLAYNNDEAYSPEENFNVPFQFPDEFALKPLETLKGCFIFIIGNSIKNICFFHNEYYDEEHYKMYRLKYRF